MEPIIEIKNLGKRYKINHEKGKYIALRDVLANIFRKPFSFIKDKTKNFAGINTKEDYWALKGVNLEINRGEIVGIIGKNGAGKSTLLKILSQITPPTEGEAIIKGKVGSLLEVGTGFHPELTGRENIFLNGAILGMGKKEISEKFDKIVEFAGIDKFLDTPVKYYSSGMYVRLAFSVAAHMEPDILLVDEVLAVGDAEFQKKCLGKMEEVTQKDNRTILFISHNMGAIKSICKKTIWIEDSRIKAFGETNKVIEDYTVGHAKNTSVIIKPSTDKDISFTNITINDRDGKQTNTIKVDDEFTVITKFEVQKDTRNAEISLFIRNSSGTNVTFTNLSDSFNQKSVPLSKGRYVAKTTIRKNFLMPGDYFLSISAHERGIRKIDGYENIITLSVAENNSPMMNYGRAAQSLAVVLSDATWIINNEK